MFNSKTFATLMILMVVLVAGTAIAGGDVNYKIYGKVHATLDMQNDGDQSVIALNSNASRIGFKGGYELNENFTAIWKVESEFNLNENSSRTWMSRNTYGGLKGKWGKVRAGNFDTPMKDLGLATTYFNDQVGDRRQMSMGHDMRINNQLAYSTNLDGSFAATLAYMLDQNDWTDEDNEAATAVSIGADFTGEAFMVGVAWESRTAGNFSPVADAAESESTYRVAANYSGDAFGVNGLYQGTSNAGGADGMSSTMFGLEAMFKASDAFHIKAGYTLTDPDTDTDDDGYNLIAFGVDHPVSEDVTFYIQYAMMSNDDGAFAGLNAGEATGGGWGGSITPAVTGTAPDLSVENPNNISLGMIVDF